MMILRKPYAFLIKHFKIIHLIISAILLYIVYKFRNIYIYLGKCISDIVNKYDAFSYIDYKIFIFIIMGGILLYLIYWLLKYKDKPRKVYLFTIIGYGIISIILFILFTFFNSFTTDSIESKTLRLFRDIIFICNLFQYGIIIFMIIRGMGFNIKKFNFEKDAQELNLTNEDNEEVEVNFKIDTTNLMRGVRKKKREFGYFLKEFRIYVMILLVVVISILVFKFYNYYKDNYKVYGEGQYVGVYKYINILDSYLKIDDDNNYVVVKFNTFTNGKKEKLNTGNIKLLVDKKMYIPNKNVCYKFNNIAPCYKQQYLLGKEDTYILVYEVEEINVDSSYIIYDEIYDKNFKIKLSIKK